MTAQRLGAARSFLFVPGSRPDRFGRAMAAGADVVILDLEDAVAVQDKEAARGYVVDWLSAHQAVVRVNANGTRWHQDDLAAIAHSPGLMGVVIPKAGGTASLRSALEILNSETLLMPLIESAAGLLDAVAVARSVRVARLLFGNVDFGLDIGVLEPSECERELILARSTLVLVSAAAALPAPVDGVFTALDDKVGLSARVNRVRSLGMSGSLCIHPDQVPTVNERHTVDAKAVRWAERVCAAEVSGGGAVVALEGEMLDLPQFERARALLRRVGRVSPAGC